MERVLRRMVKWFARLSNFERAAVVVTVLVFADFGYAMYAKGVFEQQADQRLYRKIEGYAEGTKKSGVYVETLTPSAFLASVSPKEHVYFLLGKEETAIVSLNGNTIRVVERVGSAVTVAAIEESLLKKGVSYEWLKPGTPPAMFFERLLRPGMISLVLFGGFFYMLMLTSGISLFNRDLEAIYPEEIEGSFDDLIGYEEIKEEMTQLLEIITRNSAYAAYGIEDTFNILFSGKAGTGKSKFALYLAKALDVPIVTTSGSLDEIHVGSGARKVRTLFANATKAAKHSVNRSAIVFIDEAQKLLRTRGVAHEERWADDTANELLAHLDGVQSSKGVNIIVIMASNFDKGDFEMDEAMLRRFRKKIHFRIPNQQERVAILAHYLERVEEKEERMCLEPIAKQMAGMSPALIEGVVYEAALLGLRNGKKLGILELRQSLELMLLGRSSRETTRKREKIREIVCVHEIGHFLVRWHREMERFNGDLAAVETSSTLVKVSSEEVLQIGALGYVMSYEGEEISLRTVEEMEWEIRTLYGGLAAERLVFGRQGSTTGAVDDIKKATRLLQHMIVEGAVYEPAKLDYTHLDAKEMMQESLQRHAQMLYEESYGIVEMHNDLLTFLAQKLMEEWSLEKARLFTLIGEFMQKKKRQIDALDAGFGFYEESA